MQNAPSVVYPVGRFSLHARLALIAFVFCGAAGVFGVTSVWPSEHGLVFSVVLSGGWILWLWTAWQRDAASPAGALRWNAGAMGDEWRPGAGSWWWQEDGRTQAVPVVGLARRLDWGGGMLLHGQTGRRARWFWVSATLAESRWGEFRRAIEAQANPG